MSSESSPMVPGTHWGQTVQGFDAEIGAQEVLCVYCLMDHDRTPPKQLVIYDGKSICINHFTQYVMPDA